MNQFCSGQKPERVYAQPCRHLFWLILLLLSTSLSAQDWEYPNGSPSSQFTRQNIYFQWKSDPQDVMYSFYWTTYPFPDDRWFYENRQNYFSTTYSKESCFTGHTKSSVEYFCPCYTTKDPIVLALGGHTNYARVVYKHFNSTCSKSSMRINSQLAFAVKVPVFPPPLPEQGQYYSCSDGSVKITVNTPLDIHHGERPFSVIWNLLDTSDPLNPKRTLIKKDDNVYGSLKSTLEYNIGNKLAAVIEVFSSRKYGSDCVVDGLPLLIPVTPVVSMPLNPPKPIFVKQCESAPITVTVPNEYGYDGVTWYEDLLGPAIADGFSFVVPKGSGLRDYYIEYYKKLSADCSARSPKSPVYVYSSPSLNPPVTNGQQIYDWRHLDEQDCFTSRVDPVTQTTYPYYADLPDQELLTTVFQNITDAISGTQTACFNLSDVKLYTEWVATTSTHQTAHDWYDVDNNGVAVHRVCAENITPDESETGYKVYELKGNYNFNLNYCGPGGELLSGGNVSCPINGALHKVKIATRPPGTLIDMGCTFPPEALVQSFMDREATSCSRMETFTVCPKKNTEIGPTPEAVSSYFFGDGVIPPAWESLMSYEWQESEGLSATNIRNPEVNYSGMPVPNYNIKVYHCKISFKGIPTVFNPATMIYCAFVYKCNFCGSVIDKPFSIDN